MSNFVVTINNSILRNAEFIPFSKSQSEPKIKFTRQPNEKYTVIMIDPDAPSRTNPIYKYWLHYLIINNDQIAVPFNPPAPPKNSGKHRYIFYLLRQKNIIDKNRLNLKTEGSGIKRKNFNFTEFIADNNLDIVDNIYFETENE